MMASAELEQASAIATPDDSELDGVVERLKQDKAADRAAGKEQGMKDGVAFTRDTAKLAQVKKICDEETDVDVMLEMIDQLEERDYLDELAEQADADKETFLEGYADGFALGVGLVWDKIKDRL